MTPRLKSLELHGYKTFAGRTTFEFPSDVTAIVGPNGSGKSNIADALRWVLGEQSYSLLRGRKTEDMIFSGSEQRSRAGMASATITFANEDGWLPIDFNEVSITRRAYRDGQNEYLLNGQRVRLKEITELLGKSGLSERTYTIIGQGLVDAALSLKPEERRRFFEEAAGIGLYRGRRDESLNRLDTTRRNLERVLDILSELEPRMHSLEKQARKAMEYERVRADLHLLLRDWYGYHWRKTQEELDHTREVVRVQEARLETAREKAREVEQSLNELREQVQHLRGQLNEWHAQSAAMHTRWEKTGRALAVMDERRRALLQQRQSIETDSARLDEEQKARAERLEILIEERDRLQDEMDEAQRKAAVARKQLQARLSERSRVEQSLRDARRALVAAETAQVQVKAHQNELTTRIDNLRKNKISLSAAVSAESEGLKKAQARQKDALQQQQAAEEQVKSAENHLHEHRSAQAEFETARKRSQDDVARLETDRTRQAAQLEVLEQADRSLSGLANGAKFLLQEARGGRLKGGYEPIGVGLVVPAAYEVAIAAALGEALDGVLLDSSADVEAALKLLTGGDKGRTVLLPSAALRDDGASVSPLADEGCLGAAADLIQAQGDWARSLRALLGQVWLVRDRASARRCLGMIPAQGRLVTLQGEIFYGSGVVVAGQGARAAISRPRKIIELREAVQQSTKSAAAATLLLKETEAALNAHRAQERELENAQRQAGQSLNRVHQAYQQVTLEVDQIRQRFDYQARQLAGLDGQIARAEQEHANGQAEVDKNVQKIAACNEQIRAHNQTLGKLPVDELQSQEVHWNTAAAVSGRALKEADRRLSEHRELIEQSQRRVTALQQRAIQTEQAIAQLEAEDLALRGEETLMMGELQALQAQIDPAEQRMAETDVAYSERQTVLSAAQQAATLAERHAAQSQMELNRGREQRDTLRRRIEDDFGLVSYEYNPDSSGPTPLPFEGMVEALHDIREIPPDLEDGINRKRSLLRRIGPINPEVQQEYTSVKERFEFLTQQVGDLKKADLDLRQVIAELDDLMRREFRKTFDAVAAEFRHMFTRLFGGGSARLVLSDDNNPTEAGIDIEARLPGRREQGLSLLSGGERSLTAVALISSLLKVSPTPFCVMDEVDAMLDEANVGRFRDLLVELSERTQFILVTHNRNTVQAANVIYGVTMGPDSASQVISLRLDEIGDEMVR